MMAISKREKWEQIQRESPELADLLKGMQARGMTIASLHYTPTDGPLPDDGAWTGVVRVTPMGSVYLVEK